MTTEIYEVPESITELFEDVKNSEGFSSYRIIDYTEGKEMNNSESMAYFCELVGITPDSIQEDDGTQVTVKHPDFKQGIVIDAGGLGDFNSHSFECRWAGNNSFKEPENRWDALKSVLSQGIQQADGQRAMTEANLFRDLLETMASLEKKYPETEVTLPTAVVRVEVPSFRQ